MAGKPWTADEIAELRVVYTTSATSEDLDLASLAKRLRRSADAVTCKAGRLGLTNIKRPGVRLRKDAPKYQDDDARRRAMSESAKARIKRDGHPRHMVGKSHSEASKKTISEKNRSWSAKQSPEEKAKRVLQALKTKAANGGNNCGRSRGTWKAGWREIGGKRNFYRSRWEANYARYLQWLKERGELRDWEHEPETFWFEKIKRGVRSYLPDFRVIENDGTSLLHEVKGWMDARSKTTLKRMAKYHPGETIVVIRERQYSEISRKVGSLIEGWEFSGKGGRQ